MTKKEEGAGKSPARKNTRAHASTSVDELPGAGVWMKNYRIVHTFPDGSKHEETLFDLYERDVKRRVNGELAPILSTFRRWIERTRGRVGGRPLGGGVKRPLPDEIWSDYLDLQIRNPGLPNQTLVKMLKRKLADDQPDAEERTIARWVDAALKD